MYDIYVDSVKCYTFRWTEAENSNSSRDREGVWCIVQSTHYIIFTCCYTRPGYVVKLHPDPGMS